MVIHAGKIETITLEETLKLFELPRNIGEFRDKEVIIGVGRFGPYIKHNNKFVSLPKDVDPLEVQLEEAVVLIEEKEKKDKEKIIKLFDEEPDLQVLNGRYGPYIKYQKSNYKIPKKTEPKELTLDDCKKIIEDSTKDKSKTKNTKKTAADDGSATKSKSAKSTTKRETKTSKASTSKSKTGKSSIKK